ncbi:hypothetical protein [Chryseobacterium gleum]|uniref:hypothetical protein n=1 Tax=Chryseobacterium gleum TaxID=250 RepID=UPI00241F0670|nr:hypothetical protein [Chryseobacterium gleum]
MHKLNTEFAFFRFNSTINQGPYNITWYKLEEINDDEEGKGLNNEELDQLKSFISNNINNFPGSQTISIYNGEDAPYYSNMFNNPLENINFPSNIIIRKSPQLNQDGSICKYMDVILTDQNDKDNHRYDLDFDIIGKINW